MKAPSKRELERRRKVLDLLGALCERLTPEERQMLDALNAEAADELGLPRLKDLANPGRAPHCAGRSP